MTGTNGMSMKYATVVVGAGSIGQAIAHTISAGRHVVLPDLRRENAAAKVLAALAQVRRRAPQPRSAVVVG